MKNFNVEIKIVDNETLFRKNVGYEGELNVYFSDNYRKYSTLNHGNRKRFVLLYSSDFVIPVLIRKYGPFISATFESEPCHYSDTGESLKQFLTACCRYLQVKEHVKWIPQTPAHSFFNDYPEKAKTILFGSYVIDLSKEEDEIFSNFKSSFRTGVRRAEKGEVIVKIGGQELVSDFSAIESEMWQRSNVSLDHSHDKFYDDLFSTMGENVVMGVTYKDGHPQVGLAIYYNQTAAYCMLAGRVAKNEPGSNQYLYWKMIQYMKTLGVKEFVIVGYRLKVDKDTKVYNIQKFKDDFGAELRTGYMFKVTFSSFYKKTYEILMKLIEIIRTRKISLKKNPDLIDQEIHKWPEFNQ